MGNQFNTSGGWVIEITTSHENSLSAHAKLKNGERNVNVLATSADELQMHLIRWGVTAKQDEWEKFIGWANSIR